MPQIVPIRDLKNTSKISELCHNSDEPVYITKNGYGDMVIMSIETYEKALFLLDAYRKIDEAEQDVKDGKIKDAVSSLQDLKQKYEL
ncbi:MAG: type II toxin-antitoxin system Phd/YefM family antitoxin [Bacillota bacterium]|nr:type II toxin-antitoxin system Phd/YefM family antitoxin [Bacillota bacterium]